MAAVCVLGEFIYLVRGEKGSLSQKGKFVRFMSGPRSCVESLQGMSVAPAYGVTFNAQCPVVSELLKCLHSGGGPSIRPELQLASDKRFTGHYKSDPSPANFVPYDVVAACLGLDPNCLTPIGQHYTRYAVWVCDG